MKTNKTKIIIRKISNENKQVCDAYKIAVKSEKSQIAVSAMSRECYDYKNMSQAVALTEFFVALMKAKLMSQKDLEALATRDMTMRNRMYDYIVKYNVITYEKTTNRAQSHLEVLKRAIRHASSDTVAKLLKRIA
jgi:hypothetical protein